MRYWTAAVTRWQQEQRAAHHVERQGFRFYLPQMLEITETGVRRRTLLFPGYIFIQIVDRWHSLMGTKGIARLFFSDERPVRMCDSDVRNLQSLEDEAGLVVLAPRFSSGESVLVGAEGGAFAGKTGIYQGQSAAGRCFVLFELIGRRVRMQLRESALSAAA